MKADDGEMIECPSCDARDASIARPVAWAI